MAEVIEARPSAVACIFQTSRSGLDDWWTALALATALLVVTLRPMALADEIPAPPSRPFVVFNQKTIEGVRSPLNYTDAKQVFAIVLDALDANVRVYPSENYYYFQLYAGGMTIWGNLRFDVTDRDRGIIHLGYFEYDENGRHQDREGVSGTFPASDGVVVKRLAPLLYSVSFRGKTVTFRLTGAVDGTMPALAKNEVFVGSIFDEGSLKFALLFNRKTNHFMYVLMEEKDIPEHFDAIGHQALIGRRTGYAFFDDAVHTRKILIGAHGWSVDRNDYYDGPFDQLPDNQDTNLGKYVQLAYPFTRGHVDRFGQFTDQPGSRALIFPYSVYYDDEEITRIVRDGEKRRLSEDLLYACITPDPSEAYEADTSHAAPRTAGEVSTGKLTGKVTSGRRESSKPSPAH